MIGRRAPFGYEYAWFPRWSALERLYIRIFGSPDLSSRFRFMAVRSIFPKSAQRILDVGCGNGLYAFYMKRIYPDAEVLGFDVDTVRIEWARTAAEKFGLKGLKFKTGTVESSLSAFQNNTFNLVVSVESLQYVDDYLSALKEIRRILAQEGRLILHLPLREKKEANERHLFSTGMLLSDFESVGLKVECDYQTLGGVHHTLATLFQKIGKHRPASSIVFPLFVLMGALWPNRYKSGMHGLYLLRRTDASS